MSVAKLDAGELQVHLREHRESADEACRLCRRREGVRSLGVEEILEKLERDQDPFGFRPRGENVDEWLRP